MLIHTHTHTHTHTHGMHFNLHNLLIKFIIIVIPNFLLFVNFSYCQSSTEQIIMLRWRDTKFL